MTDLISYWDPNITAPDVPMGVCRSIPVTDAMRRQDERERAARERRQTDWQLRIEPNVVIRVKPLPKRRVCGGCGKAITKRNRCRACWLAQQPFRESRCACGALKGNKRAAQCCACFLAQRRLQRPRCVTCTKLLTHPNTSGYCLTCFPRKGNVASLEKARATKVAQRQERVA